jgi:O-antigen/teichoic acid export membrane protein|tara:strand:- start:6314 stop:7483 length:1170 start_codon:yes stop_codon:yes gene_type:complete
MTDEKNKIKELIIKFKDLGSLGIGVATSNAIGAIFWLYIASIIGPEKYGEVSYLISIVIITSTIALIGSPKTITVFTAKGVKINPAIFVMVISTSIVTAVALFLIFISDFSVSLYIIGYVIFVLITSSLLGKKLYKNYSKIIISQKILMVVSAIGFFYIIGYQGIVLGIAISFFPFIFLIYKELKNTKINFSLVKSHSSFMFNNYLLSISQEFAGSIEKLIIVPLLGFTILGNYQLGIQFLAVLSIIPGIVGQYTLSHDATGNENKILKKMLILFSVLIALLSIILIPIALPIVYPEYTEAVQIIQIISISIIPTTITSTYISKFLGVDKSKIVLIGSTLFLGVQIPGIIILGEIWGINGIAISIVISSSIQAVYYIFTYRKYYGTIKK